MNALVSEANTITIEMQRQTTYTVMLQIPVSYLKPSERVSDSVEGVESSPVVLSGHDESLRTSSASETTQSFASELEYREVRIEIE